MGVNTTYLSHQRGNLARGRRLADLNKGGTGENEGNGGEEAQSLGTACRDRQGGLPD